MPLLIIAIILFVIADLLIRILRARMMEQKLKQEREAILKESLKLDFTREAKSLKRVEVAQAKARILCVDDEEVILGSFRKILVIDGYSVDTVETGQEALGLIQQNSYDFVFTDLKMPAMDGVEVTKAVKHLRPDIDVVIITGYATVETAVETMKQGAMDYIQKPFTEEELLAFVKKILVKRQDRIEKLLKPKVHITPAHATACSEKGEFSIPGGMFIAPNHTWVSLNPSGTVQVGIDDFARKLIGRVQTVEVPAPGTHIKAGDPLCTIRTASRGLSFHSPLSGRISRVNSQLKEGFEETELFSYDNSWICFLEAVNLDAELKPMTIGKGAVSFFQEDIDRCIALLAENQGEAKTGKRFSIGELQQLPDSQWNQLVAEFFKR